MASFSSMPATHSTFQPSPSTSLGYQIIRIRAGNRATNNARFPSVWHSLTHSTAAEGATQRVLVGGSGAAYRGPWPGPTGTCQAAGRPARWSAQRQRWWRHQRRSGTEPQCGEWCRWKPQCQSTAERHNVVFYQHRFGAVRIGIPSSSHRPPTLQSGHQRTVFHCSHEGLVSTCLAPMFASNGRSCNSIAIACRPLR